MKKVQDNPPHTFLSSLCYSEIGINLRFDFIVNSRLVLFPEAEAPNLCLERLWYGR